MGLGMRKGKRKGEGQGNTRWVNTLEACYACISETVTRAPR
jgi:hypothetical protein